MTSRPAARRLNNAIAKALAGMKPPDDLTVTQWAERNRRLSTEASAEPGPWRTSRTPYLREPMDAFTDPKVRRIVMVAASQVGKSEFELNAIGYIIDEDPGSILFIHPTTIDASIGAQAKLLLMALAMMPDTALTGDGIAADYNGDHYWSNNAEAERLPLRGGNWHNGAGAGVFALYLNSPRTLSNHGVGFRAAFENL